MRNAGTKGLHFFHLKLTFLLLSIIMVSSALAQQPVLEFSTLDALSTIANRTTKAIIQDSSGYLWIGTQDGLFRFDGQNVFSYFMDQNNPNSLPSSSINKLFIDNENNLWIGTNGGLSKYNPEFNNFTYANVETELNSPKEYSIMEIAMDKSGRLFIAFNKEIFKYEKSRKIFSKVLKIEHGNIKALAFDDHNNIWFATSMNGGLFCFDQEKKQLKSFLNDPASKQSISINEINDIAISAETLWIATIGCGIDTYNLKSKSFKHYVSSIYPENYTNTIFIDKKKDIWICTAGSLKLFNAEKDNFYNYYYQPDNPKSVGESLTGFYEDLQGNYWSIHYIGGLRVAINNYKFNHIEPNPQAFWRTSDKNITALSYDGSGNLWIGNYSKGIDVFNWENRTTVKYTHAPNDPKSIGKGTIFCIFRDSKQQMWVGSYSGGLQKFNQETKNFESYQNIPGDTLSIALNDVQSISEGANGDLWLATLGKGVDRFDIKNKTFHHYNNKNNRLSNDFTLQVMNDSRKNLWVVTSWGISLLSKGESIFKNFTYSKNDTTSLSSDEARSIYEDDKHNIWVGTSNGLSKFNFKSQNFTRYSAGLKDKHIVSIISDKKNNIWVGTNAGISKFDQATLKFSNFDQNYGLQSRQFIERSCCKDSQNELFFGGSAGIALFNPDSLVIETRKPTVVLTDFRLFNKSLTYKNDSSKIDRHISFATKIVLNYSDKSIAFLYQAINLTEAAKINYAYKLDGFDGDWIYERENREANYTNLSPGKYTFRVKAKFENGDWNEKDTSVELFVIPPWWMTTWFKIMMILIILIVIFGIVYLKISQLRKQSEKLEEIVAKRTTEILNKNDLLNTQASALEQKNYQLKNLNSTKDKLFSIISHDLRSPFNAILGFHSLLVSNYSEYTETERQKMIGQVHSASNKVYELVENLLNWARIQTGSIQHSPVRFDVKNEILGKCDLYGKIAEIKGISLKHQLFDKLEAFADINLLKTVLRNLINNAIKFTPAGGNILITAMRDNQFIEISVIDSGIGMTRKKIETLFSLEKTRTKNGTDGEKGSGLGLVLCKEFVEKNKGTITVVSQPGKGSTFSFTVPAMPAT